MQREIARNDEKQPEKINDRGIATKYRNISRYNDIQGEPTRDSDYWRQLAKEGDSF